MSYSQLDQATVQINFALDARYLRDGEHTLIIPLSNEVATLIGLIAIHWGGFEQRMDGLIDALFPRLNKSPPDNWRRLNFKRRRKLFKEVATEYTRTLFPAETEVLHGIADRSGDLHWRRNVVVHGYIEMASSSNMDIGEEAAFHARGVHNSKDVSVSLDTDTLEKLRHDIAHLGGNLMASVFRMGGNISNGSPELVVPDSKILNGPESGNFQFLPTPNINKTS